MKLIIKIFILSLVINISFWIAPQAVMAQEITIGFQVFYDDLSPYGSWVDNPEYGYVWFPNVSAGFTPYGTNGYWILTDAGWTWVSNYSWGWAPFHYGRWYNDPMYGPMWVPGNEWGPGWVTWRQSEGYYGWAPIGPGISIELAYSSGYDVPNDHWTFVRNGDFGRTNISNYYVDNSTNVTIIQNSTVINNTYVDDKHKTKYNSGPLRTDVEKHAGKVFAPAAIKESSKHGESVYKGGLQLYRPAVQKNPSSEKKEAPAKVTNLKELKTPSHKMEKQSTQPQQKSEPVRQQPQQQKNTNQPVKQQPEKSQQKMEPARQQPSHQKSPDPPSKQQPAPIPQKVEPPRQQPSQQKNPDQPSKQQPAPTPQKVEPPRQQPSQQKNPDQYKQQPAPTPQKTEPPRQQKEQPNHQQGPQPKRNDQQKLPQNPSGDKHPH